MGISSSRRILVASIPTFEGQVDRTADVLFQSWSLFMVQASTTKVLHIVLLDEAGREPLLNCSRYYDMNSESFRHIRSNNINTTIDYSPI